MAFATPTELAARLNVEFDTAEEIQATTLLEDATALLQGVIGQNVYPQTTSTIAVKLRACDGWVMLPAQPVVAVSAVSIDGAAFDGYELVDGHLWIGPRAAMWSDVEVTFTHGHEEVPAELRTYCLILASQMLAAHETLGTPSTVGVQSHSEQVGQWSETFTWSTGQGDASSFELPRRIADRLRARYGSTSVSVGSRWP